MGKAYAAFGTKEFTEPITPINDADFFPYLLRIPNSLYMQKVIPL